MAREFVVRDAAGRTVRLAVDDAAEAVLRREGREQLMELADRIDPEPTHEAISKRMRRDGSTFVLAAENEYAEWSERRQKREADLSAGEPGGDWPTHEAIRSRMERTGEPYTLAATALAAGEEEPSAGSGEATTTLSGDAAHHAIVALLSRRGLGSDSYGTVAGELVASGKIAT